MDKLFERKSSISYSINYDFNIFKKDRLIRINNAYEGYNNRLREKIKFLHPSLGYLIEVLINEEDEFRKFTLSVLLLKKKFSEEIILLSY